MGLLTGFRDGIGQWVFKVAFKRVAAAVISFLLGLLTSAKVAAVLANSGVSYDPVALDNFLTGLITAGGVMLHDWLRIKLNFKWI